MNLLSLTCRFLLVYVTAMLAIMNFPDLGMASDIRVSASVSSTNLSPGEQFTLNIMVQTRKPRDVSNPELPELTGMRYLSTIPRTTTSYSLVNGMAQMTYYYRYTVQAVDSGAYQIPPVYVDVDHREYASEPVTVIIRPSETGTSQRPVARRTDRPPIFMELELSEERPVRGQQIVTEIVLYFRNKLEVSSFHVTGSWQTEGFWREDLNHGQTRQTETVILGGVEYSRAVLGRYALFATRSGELTIPSYSVRASVRQSARFRDRYSSFFDGFGRQRNIDLETSSLTLQVLSPPTPPDEGQRINAIGQFNIKRRLSDERVILGESVDMITEVNGSGNLGMIVRPAFDYPGSFDTHRPREIFERNKQAPRLSGTKQFRDVLIARSAGIFTIPESTLLVYNDATRQYERHELPELTLEVIRDPNTPFTLAHRDAFSVQPVRRNVTWQQEARTPFYNLWWFWFSLVFPFALFIMGYRVYRYRQKLSSDERFYRYKQAPEKAMERIDQAASVFDAKSIYRGIYQAISHFITDRLTLPAAGMTEEQLTEELRKQNVASPLVNRVQTLLHKSAIIRYAPDPPETNAAPDLSEARAIVSELKRQL